MKILIIVSILLLSAFQPAVADQTLKEIMTPPVDSVDRENLRIWVPIERRSKCRLIIDILDSENQIIRHLVDFLAGPGYYNFYWDKKTDSGLFVESSNYRYEIKDCTTEKSGLVKVAYTGIVIEVESALGVFAEEFEGDSMSLSFEQRSVKDSLISTLTYKNLREGFHKFNLPKISRIFQDRYTLLIYVNGKLVDRKQGKAIGPK